MASEAEGGVATGVAEYREDFHHSRSLQPKFKDCVFDSKNADGLLQWIRLINGIVQNLPGGHPLECFLDNFLNRHSTQKQTRPSFLDEADLLITAPQECADRSENEGLEHPLGSAENLEKYYQLSESSQKLDKMLFQTLFTIVKGPMLDLITDLTGENARYTFAIIAMWRHGELGSSTRRIKATTAMAELTYNGDPAKWKLDFIARCREMIAAGVSVEHYMVQCANKSRFRDENLHWKRRFGTLFYGLISRRIAWRIQ